MQKLSPSRKKVLISTGELSGDLYGSELFTHLKNKFGENIETFCLLPGELKRLGAKPILNSYIHSITGISEALTNITKALQDLLTVKKFLFHVKPDTVILIDFPEFNMRVARWAKKCGSKVIYFIPPQMWGWREWRIKSLRQNSDFIIVILPFEVDYYSNKGLKVHFFGHPIVDIVKKELRNFPKWKNPDRPKGKPLIGVMPGSRSSELKHHIPILKLAIKKLSKMLPGAKFLVPLAPSLKKKEALWVKNELNMPERRVYFATENRYHSIKMCDFCIVASGTASLEVALLGVPMLVFYKVSPLSALVARLLHKVPYASLPNLICGGAVVPELLQDKATPDIVAYFTYSILNSPDLQRAQRKCFDFIRTSIGDAGVMTKIANFIVEHLTC